MIEAELKVRSTMRTAFLGSNDCGQQITLISDYWVGKYSGQVTTEKTNGL